MVGLERLTVNFSAIVKASLDTNVSFIPSIKSKVYYILSNAEL